MTTETLQHETQDRTTNQARLDGFHSDTGGQTPSRNTRSQTTESDPCALNNVLRAADPDTPWSEIHRRWQRRIGNGGGE